jgi:hypothetical protein
MFSMLTALFAKRLCAALPWKNARLVCLSYLIVAMLRHRTVNLVKLSAEAAGGLLAESLYRRFQNFFLRFVMPFDDIARLVVEKLPRPEGGWVLSMDRTNWKYGRTHLNLLVIALVVGKVAVPVVWRALPRATKRGNSKTAHRIELMKRLLRVVPASEIRALTMDRESERSGDRRSAGAPAGWRSHQLIGRHWLQWLDEQEVGYVVRVKRDTLVDGLAASSRPPRSSRRKKIRGLELFFSGCRICGRNTREDFLYLASNRFHGKEALALYRLRWGIERIFGHFKKRGFDLETTHLSDASKIEKLIGVLTLAFLVSFGWGCEMKSATRLSATQKRKSLFRLSLDRISQIFANKDRFADEIHGLFEWFGRPKYESIYVV